MLPSHELELKISRYIRAAARDGWRPTTLTELGNAVGSHDYGSILDALQRLHDQGCISIRKWTSQFGFVEFEGEEDTGTFFGRGSFEMKIGFSGRVYFEALEQQDRLAASASAGLVEFLEGSREILARDLNRYLASLERASIDIPQISRHDLESMSFDLDIRLQAEEVFSSLRLAETADYLSGMKKELAAMMDPVADALRRLGDSISRDMLNCRDLLTGALQTSESYTAILDQMAALSEISGSLPQALRRAWAPEILGARLGAVEDALRNVRAWESRLTELTSATGHGLASGIFPKELEVAGQFALDYASLVERLPPPANLRVSAGHEERTTGYRAEELGAKLESELVKLDPRLLDLRKRTWQNMQMGGPGGARLAAAGARELYTEILHRLAPDEEVFRTGLWTQRSDKTITRPTRMMRVQYLVGEHASRLGMLMQFTDSVEQANKFTHTFADDAEMVRIYLSQLENCIYLLFVASKRGGR